MTVNLAWSVEGPSDAPVLVLLNSLGATTSMWDRQVGALAERWRVVRIDARGHGPSPAAPPVPAGAGCTLADLGADVLAVLDQIGAERVHVAGLSVGGMTAMWLAVHHPQRIARLALLCTSAFLPPASGWLDRAGLARNGELGSVAAAVVERWVTPAFAERHPDRVRQLIAELVATDPESYAQCCEAVAGMDLRPDLPLITAPTLVICGVDDPATPPQHAHTIADGIAGSRMEVLADAAHLATVEQPGRITRLLLEHFGDGATLSGGYATRRAVLGDEHVDRAIATSTSFTEPFQEFITRYAWGEIWSRPAISRRERSIATIAALVSLGADHEIAMHLRAGVRNGLTAAEISEILLHTALYAGLPRANRAFAIAQQTLAELDASPTPEET